MKSLNEERNGILRPFRKAASACLTLTMLATGTSIFAQNAPTVDDFTTTGQEDNGVAIFTQAPSNFYADQDNDPIVHVKLMSLPGNGILTDSSGTVFNIGDTLLTPNGSFPELGFLPNSNYNGTESFEYNAFDGTSYADSNATITVVVSPVNDAPTGIGLNTLAIDENSPIGSTIGNLSTNDVDAGDTHAYALVSGVGDADNSSFSILGNKLQAEEAFNFEQKSSYSIRVKTTDSGNESYEIPFVITVNDVNDKPELYLVSEVVLSGDSVKFSSSHFTMKFSDEDNNALDRIKITSLPAMGDLKLAGTPVNIGDEILTSALGDLKYTAPGNFAGSTSFNWNGFDGQDYASYDGEVKVRVNFKRAPSSNVSTSPAPSAIPASNTRDSVILNSASSSGTTTVPIGGGVVRPGSGATRPNGGGSATTTSAGRKTTPTTATAVIAGIENPAEFMVHNNYPNPFGTSTSIRYELPAEYMVTVKVFNDLGAEIAVLADGVQEAGVQTLTWTPEDNLPNGQYFYNINIYSIDGTQMAFKTGVMVKVK